jgi:hypothetical protein
MKERPILFSAPMVRAILEGRKTQTRRIVKRQPPLAFEWNRVRRVGQWFHIEADYNQKEQRNEPVMFTVDSPHGIEGDRLWVKETFTRVHPGMLQSLDPDPDSPQGETVFRADANGGYVGAMIDRAKWRPSIFMPRKLSRITLEITNVRVERLQDISEEDAWAEGCRRGEPTENGGWFPADEPGPRGSTSGWDCARDWYADLWDLLNGDKQPWDSNPWVWVIEFPRYQEGRAA